jgi:hypothetical protein
MRQHLLTILLLVAAHLCAAQDNKTIETTIKALEQKAVKGILQSDTALLKEVWAPEFLVNTPRNNIANGRSAVFQNQRAGLINYSAFERVVEQVLVQKDMVITMGHETYTPGQDLPEAREGQPVKRRFTNVWMRQGGQWLQVARHASIICSE